MSNQVTWLHLVAEESTAADRELTEASKSKILIRSLDHLDAQPQSDLSHSPYVGITKITFSRFPQPDDDDGDDD